MGILVAVTTGRLHEHLVFNMSELTTYDQVRTIILNYTKSKKLTKRQSDPVPMEVDGIGDKGKGTTKGNKYCSICKTETHWTS